MLALLGDPASFVGILRRDDGTLHGGQFGLPGGMREENESAWECALRESREEIGSFVDVELLGLLGEYNTHVSRFRVDVHVCHLPAPPAWCPDELEVSGIVVIPVTDLLEQYRSMPRVRESWKLPIDIGFDLDMSRYLVAGEAQPKGRGQQVKTSSGVIETPYVWGLTARILYDFLGRVWTV